MSRFSNVVLMLALCFMYFFETAFAQEETQEEAKDKWGVYLSSNIGVGFGGMIIQSQIFSSIVRTELSLITAVPISLAAGVDFKKINNIPIRLEGEYTYRSAQDEGLRMSGELAASTGMLNLYYDYFRKDTSTFIPYFGVGLGFGSVDLDASYLQPATIAIDLSNSGFAWNISTGVAWYINDTFAIDWNVRVVNIANAYKDMPATIITNGVTSLTMFQTRIGLRVTF